MMGLDAGRQYLLYRQPTDMRKRIDSLRDLVINKMERDPMSRDVSVFINRRRRLIKKVLCSHGTGFGIFYKRLEPSTFQLPEGSKPSWEEVAKLLEDVSGKASRNRRRSGLKIVICSVRTG